MPIPTMHQPTPTSTRARYHAAPQGGAAVGGGQRLPPPRASPAPSTRQRHLAQLTSFCPAPPGHLGKPANESGMQGWQLATPQSYALLRMFAYATLLCTHAVYCLQHPCRPSSSCCTSAVWASAGHMQLTTPSARHHPFTMPMLSRTILTAACGHVMLCTIAHFSDRLSRILRTYSRT